MQLNMHDCSYVQIAGKKIPARKNAGNAMCFKSSYSLMYRIIIERDLQSKIK